MRKVGSPSKFRVSSRTLSALSPPRFQVKTRSSAVSIPPLRGWTSGLVKLAAWLEVSAQLLLAYAFLCLIDLLGVNLHFTFFNFLHPLGCKFLS